MNQTYAYITLLCRLFQKFQLMPKISYAWSCVFHCTGNYCLEVIVVDETFCENSSHFILKWFQPYPFKEICLLEESNNKIQKIQILTIFESAIYTKSGIMP